MNRLLEKTFENRGITDTFLRDFDNPAHADLKDVDLAAAYLHDIHVRQLHIVYYTDFDMDGIMCAVTGFAGLCELGFNVSLYRPNVKHGYGFNEEDIQGLIDQYPDVACILTADVGISCDAGIKYAREHGVQVIVTDHHKQLRQNSDALCIVDPMRVDETYDHPYICGAHVMYQLLAYYAKAYCSQFAQDQIERLRVFAGIGTVSDNMRLHYENRELVRDAVAICRMFYTDNSDDFMLRCLSGHDVYRRCFYGLSVVLQLFIDYGKLKSVDDVDEQFFGFYLAPMFNSVKRLEDDIDHAFGVFFGPHPDEDAFYLYDLNEKRKQLVADCMKQIADADNPYAPYIYFCDAPAGVLGLIAQKLRDASGLPTLVLHRESDGNIHGSGRAPVWYPFLTKLLGLGLSGGGHDPAFGISMYDADVSRVFAFLQTDVAAVYQSLPADMVTMSTPDFVIATDDTGDTNIDILLFMDYLYALRDYHPFGVGFAAPDVLLKIRPSDCVAWDAIGKDKTHLRLTLRFGFVVLVWNRADAIALQNTTDPIYIRGHLELNRFNDTRTVNFIGDIVDTESEGVA